jgi:uncharacterized protein YbjT (DUF2867 family)
MTEFLVLGGTGTTGRRVARRLRAAGRTVRTASRTGGDVRVDLDEPATWPAALDGIDAAYLLEPQMQSTEEGRQRLPRFVAAAAAAGVRRLVMLSAPGVDGNEGHPLWPAEQAVMASGPEWTVVRPNWFAQNFSEAFWRTGILAGELVLPTGGGATPFVDAEDIADVATAALTGDGHHGQAYTLTGPRAVSFPEAAALIATATGRPVRHVDITPDDFTAAQVADGVPAGAARQLTGIYVAIRDGRAAALADGVQRALGRPPRPFEDYVSATAASGAWTSASLVQEP